MIDHFAAPWVAPDRYALRKDARRFETWESSYALHLGLGAAADYALSVGIGGIADRCRALAGRLREGLAAIDGVTLHDAGHEKAALVSFTVRGHTAEAVKTRLAQAGINVSTSQPASTLLDALARDLPPLVRASPHYYNLEGEIDQTVELIRASF